MGHYPKKGSVTYDERKRRWVAQIYINEQNRKFTSRCEGDCHEWLEIMRNGGNDARFRHKASDTPKEDIAQMGGTNPRQVPGFPHYYLCDGGKLYSVKGRMAVLLKPSKGKYLRMSEKRGEITVTLERLEYCIAHNISPTILSRCRLSVVRGDAGLQLMDCTEYIRQSIRRSHKRKCYNIEQMVYANLQWNTHLFSFYTGLSSHIADVKKMLEDCRKYLEKYIRDTLGIADSNRVKFICDEVTSETLDRIVNKTALVNNPITYMEKLSRGVNYRIRKVSGKVFCGNNIYHVRGNLTRTN